MFETDQKRRRMTCSDCFIYFCRQVTKQGFEGEVVPPYSARMVCYISPTGLEPHFGRGLLALFYALRPNVPNGSSETSATCTLEPLWRHNLWDRNNQRSRPKLKSQVGESRCGTGVTTVDRSVPLLRRCCPPPMSPTARTP